MQITFSDKNPLYPLAYGSTRAMHSQLEVLLIGVEEQSSRELLGEIKKLAGQMERRFNRFDNRSPLSVVNAIAHREAVEVDEELFMALELCEVFRKMSHGYFDVAALSGGDSATVTHRAGGCVQRGASYRLDASNHTVRRADEGVIIDLGGFAKGFALEQIKRLVVQAGIEKALLNFGNSSIVAIGHHPYGEWWSVGVENRAQAGAAAYEMRLRDSAASVSGRSAKGEYHIVDPHTGSRVAGEELVVVEGRSALVAEMLSTALYAAPKSLRAEILASAEEYRAVELYCQPTGGVRRVEIGGPTEKREEI